MLAEMKRCIEELVQDHPTLKLWKITHITIGFADSDLTVIDNMPKSFLRGNLWHIDNLATIWLLILQSQHGNEVI